MAIVVNGQRHTGTLAHWYTGTLLHRCTNAQVHRYTGTLVHRGTDTLIHWYTSTLILFKEPLFFEFLPPPLPVITYRHSVHEPLSVLTHGTPVRHLGSPCGHLRAMPAPSESHPSRTKSNNMLFDFWGHRRAILGQSWSHLGPIVGHFETTLGLYWNRFCAFRIKLITIKNQTTCCLIFGAILGPSWAHSWPS